MLRQSTLSHKFASLTWSRKFIILAFLLGAGWTLLAAASMVLDVSQEDRAAGKLALTEARFRLATGVGTRAWILSDSGKYTPIVDSVIQSHGEIPCPAYIPSLTASDAEGRFNHDCMWSSTSSDILLDSTVLRPSRRSDAPDLWEISALQSLHLGQPEVSTLAELSSNPYFRLMRPIIASDGCRNCHSENVFKDGSVIGGVSVTMSAEPYLATARLHSERVVIWNIVFWLVGLLGLLWAFRAVSARERRNRRDYNELALSEARLRQAQRIAQIGSWEIDLVKGKITWSREMYRIFGLNRRTSLTRDTIINCHASRRQRVCASHVAQFGRGSNYRRRISSSTGRPCDLGSQQSFRPEKCRR